MEIFCGIPVSNGIAIAPVRIVNSPLLIVPKYYIMPEKRSGELQRFECAVKRSQDDISGIKKQKRGGLAEEILDTYLLILSDVDLHQKVALYIEKKLWNAEWAVQNVIKEYTDILAKSTESYTRERVKDLHDMAIRLIEHLMTLGRKDVLLPKREEENAAKKYVLVAHTLFPSQFLQLPSEEIVGIVLEQGGKTSHTVIISRAFGIPMIIGVQNLLEKIVNGQSLLLDGYKGDVVLDADQPTIDAYEKQFDKKVKEKILLEEEVKTLSHVTKDNQSVSFNVNIDVIEELDLSTAELADGIGLFRTEFCVRNLLSFKHSEKEQYSLYSQLLQKMKHKPVIIRTLDLGGEELPSLFQTSEEENPLLGYKGIRFSLGHKELLMTQLSTLVKASVYGNLQVMIPMVSTLEEFLEVKQMFLVAHSRAKKEIEGVPDHIDFGTMLEVPSLLYQLEDLSPHCDFWSIGTNDLLQYFMASDRTNVSTAYLYSYFQPAFLRVLRDIFYKAFSLSMPVYMCGEMASDYNSIALLLGMGLRNFSVSPSQLNATITYVSKLKVSDARTLFEKALECQSVAQVQKCVSEFNKDNKFYHV